MGNTGSLHDMNANCQGDLASYNRNSRFRAEINNGGVSMKKHQLESSCLSTPILNYEREINSKLGEWTKSFPRIKTAATNEMPLKVLPHLNESLKLRITANGTILHSGGTISGRREQAAAELENKCLQQQPILMQRSRTLIYEQSGANQNALNAIQTGVPVLRRAQTQFQLNYKEKRQDIFAIAPNKNEAQSLTAAARATARSEPDLRADAAAHTAEVNATAAATNKCSKSAKANKYNKKRKAPAAPSNITANVPPSNAKAHFVAPNNSRQQSVGVEQSESTTAATLSAAAATTTTELALGKSRIFLTKAETDSNVAGQRNFLAQKKSVIPPTVVQQLPYRREKSFDATLLYERTPQSIVAEIASATPIPLQPQYTLQRVKRGDTKIPQLKQKFYFGMDTQRTAATTTNKETVNKVAALPLRNDTKLPAAIIAHKRVKQQTQTDKRTSAETASSSSRASIIMTTAVYDINVSPKQYEADNDDNGLQVHVRPMLPRRQLDIPRFSPAAAWRMLTEKQQNLQLQPQAMKLQASTQAAPQHSNTMPAINNEQPIQPVCKALKKFAASAAIDTRAPKKLTTKVCATPWTPQQDLEDEDDDDDDDSSSDGFRAKTNANDTNSLFLVDSTLNIAAATATTRRDSAKSQNGNGAASVHVFSLSLPRDGHFGTGFSDNKPINEKKSGFSSLQKIKRTVSGGNCGCIQTKYSDQVMAKILGTGTDQFKSADYDDVILTTSSSGMQQENTLDNNTSQDTGYRNDNWVLSKTKFCVIGERDNFHTASAKLNFPNNMTTNKSSQRWNTLVSREPVSLSYLTAGKHVMYLPSHNNNLTDHSYLNKINAMEQESTKCKTVDMRQNPKTKSRKRELHIRQSLQDPIPLGISNSASKHSTMRDLPGERNSLQNEKQQRFSFQSTVRLIEKRRLAEKLSKDAEIKEARRRSELEAMKRVEEDFQRKRASEKATIRQQLRLVSNLDSFDHQLNQFQSLPTNSEELPLKHKHSYDLNMNQLEERIKYNNEQANYNVYYRADPDGAVSSPSNSPVLQYANDTENTTFSFIPFDFNRTSATHLQHQIGNLNINIDGEILETQRTALFVEPYLQSIVK